MNLWRDRAAVWKKYSRPIIGVIWISVFLLGIFGYAQFYGDDFLCANVVYHAIQLFVLEANFKKADEINWMLQIARIAAPLLTVATAVKAVSLFFREQWQEQFADDSVIICGLGEKGKRLADLVRKRGDNVVIIDSNKDNAFLEEYREQGVLVIMGNAAEAQLLTQARIRQAKMLVLVCREESVNAEIVLTAQRLIQGRAGKPLTCIAHVVSPGLRRLLVEKRDPDLLDLHLFDMHDLGARVLLSEFSPLSGVRKRETPPHLLLVGTGQLSENLILQGALIWQVVRSQTTDKLFITVADADVDPWLAKLRKEHSAIDAICSFGSLALDREAPELRRGQIAGVSHAYVLLKEDEKVGIAVLSLLEHAGDQGISIVARVSRRNDLIATVQERHNKPAAAQVSFVGLLERALTLEQLLAGPIEIQARAIHGDYLYQQLQKGVEPESTPPLLPWDRLSDDFKESNRQQAVHIPDKLNAIDCGTAPLQMPDSDFVEIKPEEIEILAELEHRRFVEEREKRLWSFSPNKVFLGENKTSPFLVPWRTLDEKTKDLDRNAVRLIPILLALVGLKIVRR